MSTSRLEYEGEGLLESTTDPAPWPTIERWVAEAESRQAQVGDLAEPRAMAVATVDAGGVPDVREVLCRFLDPRGPGFVTDLGSAKAQQVAARPVMAASLTWPVLFRAIRFRGRVEVIGRDEVEAYWEGRPWGSRISHWASEQSRPVASRAELEALHAETAARWPDRPEVGAVPVPDDFGGYRIACDSVELWAGRPSRLHDRLRFERTGPGLLDDERAWRMVRLAP